MNLYEMFKQGPTEPILIDALRNFLPIAVEHLKLTHIPKIRLVRSMEDNSFGCYVDQEQVVCVVIDKRNPVDILRTLAHEMVHYQQGQDNQLKADSGETGSDIENEANAIAGIIMRLFNQAHPNYMLADPIDIAESTVTEKRKRKKKTKSRGYSGYYGYYYGGTNTGSDNSDAGGDGGGESIREGLGKSALVGVLAAALSMVASPAQAEPSDAAKALGIYRMVNRYKDYNSAALEGEATQELNNILRAIQGHPDQSKLLPIIKKMIKTDTEEEEKLPPLTIDEAHDEPEDQPGMQSTPSDPIPFPAGTTLVNVSDIYDWYKLGMAVSDLDDADPQTFNKGVPHTVFAFGSEEEEAKMRPLLQRLGFKLHDIDNPEDYQKAIRADEAIAFLESYVTENFADGKKPGRKGLAKRSGVNTKASISSLRKTAKNSSGEKQRMAHWLANMKAGKK